MLLRAVYEYAYVLSGINADRIRIKNSSRKPHMKRWIGSGYIHFFFLCFRGNAKSCIKLCGNLLDRTLTVEKATAVVCSFARLLAPVTEHGDCVNLPRLWSTGTTTKANPIHVSSLSPRLFLHFGPESHFMRIQLVWFSGDLKLVACDGSPRGGCNFWSSKQLL